MSSSAVERIRALEAKGKITRRQAEELIAALEERLPDEPAPESGDSAARDSGAGPEAPSGDQEGGYEYRYEWTPEKGSRWSTQSSSRVDPPSGENYEFDGNRIVFSRITGLRLVRSKLRDNTFGASSFNDAELVDGAMEDCTLGGATLNGLRVTGARIVDATFKGCKMNGLSLGVGCALKDVRFAGSVVTDLSLDGASALEDTKISGGAFGSARLERGSSVKDCKLSGVAITRLTLTGTRIGNCAFKGTFLSDSTMTGSELEGCTVRGCRFQGLTFTSARLVGCRIDGIGLSGLQVAETELRGVAFQDLQLDFPRMSEGLLLEACTLENVEFTRCTFHDTKLKGIKAKGLHLRDIDFSGRTIESEKELLSLVRG